MLYVEPTNRQAAQRAQEGLIYADSMALGCLFPPARPLRLDPKKKKEKI
jgi:hypothetical protein